MPIPFYGNVEINGSTTINGDITIKDNDKILKVMGKTITHHLQIEHPNYNVRSTINGTSITDTPQSSQGWGKVNTGFFSYKAPQGNGLTFIKNPSTNRNQSFNFIHINSFGTNDSDIGITQIGSTWTGPSAETGTGRLYYRVGNETGWFGQQGNNGKWRELIDNYGGQSIDGSLQIKGNVLIGLDNATQNPTPNVDIYGNLIVHNTAHDFFCGQAGSSLLRAGRNKDYCVYIGYDEVHGAMIGCNGTDQKEIHLIPDDDETGYDDPGLVIRKDALQYYDRPVAHNFVIYPYTYESDDKTTALNALLMPTNFRVGEVRLLYLTKSEGHYYFVPQLPQLKGTYVMMYVLATSDSNHQDVYVTSGDYTQINKKLQQRCDVWGGGTWDSTKETCNPTVINDDRFNMLMWLQRVK